MKKNDTTLPIPLNTVPKNPKLCGVAIAILRELEFVFHFCGGENNKTLPFRIAFIYFSHYSSSSTYFNFHNFFHSPFIGIRFVSPDAARVPQMDSLFLTKVFPTARFLLPHRTGSRK